MSFQSILFAPGAIPPKDDVQAPEFFHDLNLDQIVAGITDGRDEYNLKPFFYDRLTDLASVTYRLEIMRDLEDRQTFGKVKVFSENVRTTRHRLSEAGKRYFKYEKERWFLDAAEIYCAAILNLRRSFDEKPPSANALQSFYQYLVRYTESEAFETLADDIKHLKDGLSSIRYCMVIKGGSVTVRAFNGEADFGASIEETFAKFQQGAAKDYKVNFAQSSGMNHVDAAVVERVAQLNPAPFRELEVFFANHSNFLELPIVTFEREIQFYIAYLDYIEKFKRGGLYFCHAKMSASRKDVCSRGAFDLALAAKLIQNKSNVVCNDFALVGRERLFVVTGPNQGGKTTFARTFGQLHYLASLGCPVPGTEARLFLFDGLFTHFERGEDIKTLRGKLQDDLVRVHQILTQATSNSIIIINEIFSSTSVADGVFLGKKILDRLAQLDLLCVCVTFLDELASSTEKTVSAVAIVKPDDPTIRTFHIERCPANGLAYAEAIAEKYRVTYAWLKERLKP
jgi:DNA mismatch repair protein MutS